MKFNNYNEYQNKALRTLNDKGKELNILHCVMGMTGEIAEYLDTADVEKSLRELGDCLWYSAVLAHVFGYSLDVVRDKAFDSFREQNRYPSAKTAIIVAGEITDMLKKHIFYNKDLPEDAIIDLLGLYILCLESLCGQLGDKLLAVAWGNIKKLEARYPEKYTDQLAINRNEEAENAVSW